MAERTWLWVDPEEVERFQELRNEVSDLLGAHPVGYLMEPTIEDYQNFVRLLETAFDRLG